MEHKRNRSSGWKYAKISGHKNEEIIKEMLLYNKEVQKCFLSTIKKTNCTIVDAYTGGILENNVPCVFVGEKTKSKTDIQVLLSDNTKCNISIKKSMSGQVYLIATNRFIKGFELQYNKTIPDDVKQAIYLFWGYSLYVNDINEIIKKYGTNKKYELRKSRLVSTTLEIYDRDLYNILLVWFKNNIREITDFCFSKGLAKNRDDWANVIWYKNELGDYSLDDIYFIDELISKVEINKESIIGYGTKGGGTTIQLPFGFVQWHSPTKKIPGDIQFHHSYIKIKKIFE